MRRSRRCRGAGLRRLATPNPAAISTEMITVPSTSAGLSLRPKTALPKSTNHVGASSITRLATAITGPGRGAARAAASSPMLRAAPPASAPTSAARPSSPTEFVVEVAVITDSLFFGVLAAWSREGLLGLQLTTPVGELFRWAGLRSPRFSSCSDHHRSEHGMVESCSDCRNQE